MANLIDRLAALGPEIEKLMEIGGAAGLSLGVLHHGKPIHQANFGLRDIPQSLRQKRQYSLRVHWSND